MSYYDKYLKYKNKYLQYKNSLGLNMHGGNNPTYPSPPVNIKPNDILYINNLTITPNIDPSPRSYRHNKISSIEKLSDTPRVSEFAGGAYKRKIKSKYEQDKLLKLLETHTDTTNSHSGNTEEWLTNPEKMFSKTLPNVNKNHKYFATESISSSTTSDSLGI